jgi:hypothetical protein
MRHRRQNRARGAAELLDRLEGDVRIGESPAGAEELIVVGQGLEVRVGTFESFRDRLRRRSNGSLDVFPGPVLCDVGLLASALAHVLCHTLLRAVPHEKRPARHR